MHVLPTVAVIINSVEALVLIGRRGDAVGDNADVLPRLGIDKGGREGVQRIEWMRLVLLGIWEYVRRRVHHSSVNPCLEQEGQPVMINT